ncbi:MAG: 4'-phosphopantetheinyl transferase superfamily protein [Propionibacteriaceae bacterium]|jgi:acyl transferase domain-containing protein/phosphopantetheinyl transferase|nr:4'-phosphopantetheinyl transferase superfamily protein [Propionibacteriaceae bacterium]
MTDDRERRRRDIAIVGMAVGAPGAAFSAGAFWNNLAQGADLIQEAPPDIIEPFYFGAGDNSQVDRFYNNRGGFTDRMVTDPLRYGVLPIAADGADPDQLVSLMLTDFALSDAGLIQSGTSLENACVIIGRGQFAGLPQLVSSEMVRTAESLSHILKSALPLLPDDEIENIKRDYQSRFGRYSGDTVTANMPNLVAAGVAHRFNIHGPSYVVDAACASGIVALEHGIRLIHSGECDIAIIGAMHTTHNAVFWSAFNIMGAMSKRGVIAPFSQEADGLVIGQGAGFVILKSLERAEADGDRVYAVVKATATGSDGAGSNALVTNPDGQRRVLAEAWRRSGLDPEEVGYIEAHGTATPIGDANELATLTEFFGDHTHPKAYLGSVKSNIGHAMPAAGMFGLIKTTLALYHRQIPQTLHCEKPLTAMAQSRFEPPQELIDWQQAGLPLVAGVNAFGFGGANAHAVLQAYQEPVAQARRYRAARRRQVLPDVITLAAKTNEDLLSTIDMRHGRDRIGNMMGAPDDPYRVVVFNPTGERLALAARIVAAGQPWRGRSDIWYTNRPALHHGGQVALMFAGYSLSEEVEFESLRDEFDLSYSPFQSDDPIERQAATQYYSSLFVHQALMLTGVKPQLYTGHSVGEWHAARACGVLDQAFDDFAFDFYRDPNFQLDPKEVPDFKLVAINSVLDPGVRERLFAIPEVNISNDNCPNQIVISVLTQSLPQVRTLLDEARAFYQVLPFASALHTPYIEPVIDVPILAMKDVPVHPGSHPLWSAVTLDRIAAERTGDDEATARQFAAELAQPVLFRQLVEKLYQEAKARVFIQVGGGPLAGFVDDTLKGRDFAAVSSVSPARNSLDQLRRVHAVLYTEGSPDANTEFLGMIDAFRQAKSIHFIPQGAPLLQRLESLDQAVQRHYGPTRPEATSQGQGLAELRLEGVASPIVNALDANLRQAVALQGEVVQRFKDQGLLTSGPPPTGPHPTDARPGAETAPTKPAAPGDRPATAVPQARAGRSAADQSEARGDKMTNWRADAKRAEGMNWTPTDQLDAMVERRRPGGASTTAPSREAAEAAMAALARAEHRRGRRVDVPLRLRIEDYPATIDHSIVRQPVGWEQAHQRETYPVVPLTLSLELLIELACRQVPPGLKPVKVGPITAMNFISLNEPFDCVVRCFWKSDLVVSMTIEGHLMLDVTFAADYPAAPVGYREQLEAQLGQDHGPLLSPEQTYADYAFHRPAYHSSVAMTRNAVHGLAGQVRRAPGKGSLLDQIGQAVGLFVHLHASDNRVSFPVRVTEIKFHDDVFDQAGLFEACLLIRGMTDNFVTGEGIYERNGKPWLTYRGWVNQRLAFDRKIWDAVMTPQSHTMADEVAPGVFYFVNRNPVQQALIFVALRYLTGEEADRAESLPTWDIRSSFNLGRVALKDAVRRRLAPDQPMCYPVEIATRYDERGKLYVVGRDGQPLPPDGSDLEVSLSHKTDRAAAIAADRPVGIDLERIERRDSGFLDLAFNPAEQVLLKAQGDPDEWATRFWVAKEARAKLTGEGLRGNPRRLTVQTVAGDDISVDGSWVTTRRLEDDYILGWTV